MLAKPIKQGIKVFVVCCSMSAVWIGFKVYTGASPNEDESALSICDKLIEETCLTGQKGHPLYTDNWYTSINIAKHLFEN